MLQQETCECLVALWALAWHCEARALQGELLELCQEPFVSVRAVVWGDNFWH